jgi:hypothetical protein
MDEASAREKPLDYIRERTAAPTFPRSIPRTASREFFRARTRPPGRAAADETRPRLGGDSGSSFLCFARTDLVKKK